MERAPAEVTPLEKADAGALSSSGNRARLRHAPVVTQPGPERSARGPPGEGIVARAPAQGVASHSLAADARYLFRRARRSGKTMSRMPTMTATAQTSRAVP